MAELTGIRGVKPRTPLVLVPYAAAGAETGPADPGDPFFDGSSVFGSVGLDLRRKVGSSFALDATVNPDFGQVEVDPAVVNLTDFETFFPEKRPFFVEGAQIFDNFGRNGANNYYGFMRTEPDLFYTRRIGRAPQGYPESEFASVPRATTILGAAKFTGKSASGWSVGVLEAVTGRERARWADGDDRGRQEVEPLTNYFVLRAHRDRTRAGYGVLAHGGEPRPRSPPRSRRSSRARPTSPASTATSSSTRRRTGWCPAGWRAATSRASARRSRGCSSPRPATSSGPTGPSRGSTRPARPSAAGRAA